MVLSYTKLHRGSESKFSQYINSSEKQQIANFLVFVWYRSLIINLIKVVKLLFIKIAVKHRCFEPFQLLFRAVKFLRKTILKVTASVLSTSGDVMKVWGLSLFGCTSASQYSSTVIFDKWYIFFIKALSNT